MKIPKIRKLPSGLYNCQLRIDGRSISITDKSYDVVQAKAYATKAGLLEIKNEPEKRSVSELIDDYIELRDNILSPTTIQGYRQIQKHYFQTIMQTRADLVTDRMMQSVINNQAKTHSPKTVKNAYGLVCAAMDKNFNVKLPSQVKKPDIVLSSEEIKRLLAALDGKGETECAALLAMWLSLRMSEVRGLKWTDLRENAIQVQRALVHVKGKNEYSEKSTKTYESTRLILCPDYVLDKINALPRKSEYIITLTDKQIWYRLKKTCEEANVPQVTMHGLRHVNASIMGYLGVDVKYAQQRGGWSNEATIRRVYQGIMDEGAVQTANTIDSYFLKLVAPNC